MPPDDANTPSDGISVEELARSLEAAMAHQQMAEEVLADYPLLRLSRTTADDGGRLPTRWQYKASTPMLLFLPLTLVLPIWWSIRRFRSSAYARCNAKTPGSHVGARLTITALALVLCVGLAVFHCRGTRNPYNLGFGWCAPNGILVGGVAIGHGTMLHCYSFDLVGDGGTLVSKYRGKWLGDSFMVTYAHWTTFTSTLIIFPTLILHAVAALLAIRTIMRLRHELRRVHRVNTGHCAQCGYDLRSSQERCPECGTPIPAPTGTTTAKA